MASQATRIAGRLGFLALSLSVGTVSFFLGNYLLGLPGGVAYVLIAVCLLGLLASSTVLTDKPSRVKAALVIALSIPVGYFMINPAALSPDVQHIIDMHATDRQMRRELAKVFAGDPGFRNLSISTTHLKAVNIDIRGILTDRADLDRLRQRITTECPAVSLRTLHWDVFLSNTAQRLTGLDPDLFKSDP